MQSLDLYSLLETPALRDALEWLARRVATAGGRAYVVGGAVRDALLQQPLKDLDVEVFGLHVAQLEPVLRERFQVFAVGRSFGVFKLRGLEMDVALPRRERKTGLGHQAFQIEGDPFMTLEEAAMRRDFTLNALYWDPLSGQVRDPLGGVADLQQRRLRHCSGQFAEDPLRVLRAMQFAARFCCRLDPETLELCRSLDREGLSRERVFEEWRKLILRGERPSMGLTVLQETGWLRFFPELAALVDCPQDPHWHPEGDVWQHTLHCMDAFARHRLGDPWEDLIVGLAVLCHDLGKPQTTVFEEDRWRSPGHEAAGEAPARSFLERLTQQTDVFAEVLPLVTNHMKPAELHKADAGANAVRRLARRVGRLDRLIRVARADMGGRPPLPSEPFEAGDWLAAQAENLRVEREAPRPILQGRHLIELGYTPGAHFKGMLETAFQAQLEGEFEDLESGVDWLRQQAVNRLPEPD